MTVAPSKVTEVLRAHAAAVAGLRRARELLARATIADDGRLVLDGSPLTSERVRVEISSVFAGLEVEADGITVTHGRQASDPDSLGRGPIEAGTPVVVDLYPRTAAGFHADLARTFAVGAASDTLIRAHELCVRVLDALEAMLGPGVVAHDLWLEGRRRFLSSGCASGPAHARAGLWFPPLLGHAVGRLAHEAPFVGQGGGPLHDGDVIALETGLYGHDLGGCRVENLYLITGSGFERLTREPTELIVHANAATAGLAS
jgi:Xaa-Pro aminopeptidase